MTDGGACQSFPWKKLHGSQNSPNTYIDKETQEYSHTENLTRINTLSDSNVFFTVHESKAVMNQWQMMRKKRDDSFE